MITVNTEYIIVLTEYHTVLKPQVGEDNYANISKYFWFYTDHKLYL